MISGNQFTQLSYQDKKSTLVMICRQIDTPETSFEDVIFLLNASDKIQSSTLDSIYHDLIKLIDTTRQQQYMEQQSQNIQKIIQHDMIVQAEQKDADKLLDTL